MESKGAASESVHGVIMNGRKETCPACLRKIDRLDGSCAWCGQTICAACADFGVACLDCLEWRKQEDAPSCYCGEYAGKAKKRRPRCNGSQI